MNRELIMKAREARDKALAGHSKFKVGAAIITAEGRIYTGCNIESASYGLSVCAERVALWKALSDQERDFVEIAIVTDAHTLTSPCGACRQLLWEYCGNIRVHLHSIQGLDADHQLADLLPVPFDSRSLS
jgi:cytidine deaminase